MKKPLIPASITTTEQRVQAQVEALVPLLNLKSLTEDNAPVEASALARTDNDKEFLKQCVQIANSMHILGPEDQDGIEKAKAFERFMEKANGRLDAWKKDAKEESLAFNKAIDGRVRELRAMIDEAKQGCKNVLQPVLQAIKEKEEAERAEAEAKFKKRHLFLTEKMGMSYDMIQMRYVLQEAQLDVEFVRTADAEMLKEAVRKMVLPVKERIDKAVQEAEREAALKQKEQDRAMQLVRAGMRLDDAGNVYDTTTIISIRSLRLYDEQKFEELLASAKERNKQEPVKPAVQVQVAPAHIAANVNLDDEDAYTPGGVSDDLAKKDRELLKMAIMNVEAIMAMRPSGAIVQHTFRELEAKLKYIKQYLEATLKSKEVAA